MTLYNTRVWTCFPPTNTRHLARRQARVRGGQGGA
uniref:Uncharacterized protein n=1 Tax=Arundo donax TaxID=35708 RepID=A0A0A9AF75_ARUDO